MPALTTFRDFANRIRNPDVYTPVFTEGKGLTNMGLGYSSIAAGHFMKYAWSSSAYQQRGDRHIAWGERSVEVGFQQCPVERLIGISIASAAACAYYFNLRVSEL